MQRKYLVVVYIYIVSMLIVSCSTIKKTGINMTKPVFGDIEKSLFMEKDVSLIQEGLAGLILIVEGLDFSASGDKDLQLLIAKASLGYAILIEDENKTRAINLYNRGRDNCLNILMKDHHFKKAVKSGENFNSAVKGIKDKKLVPVLMYGGLCWGLSILASIGDPFAMVDIANAKAMVDQAMSIDDSFLCGLGYVFNGIYYCIVPSVFTGGPDVIKKNFRCAFELSENGKFLLTRYFYARFYATLMGDEKLFENQLQIVTETPIDSLPDLALFNAIAKHKADILLKTKEKYF